MLIFELQKNKIGICLITVMKVLGLHSGLPWIDAAQVPSVVRYKLWSSEIFTLQTSVMLTFAQQTSVQFFTLQTLVMFYICAANFGFVQ
jgi:hypothetical protein